MRAQDAVGSGAPAVDKLRVYYNHPLFVETMAERTSDAFQSIEPSDRGNTALLFTAHSIPLSMADNCRYVEQLMDSCRLVAEAAGHEHWKLVYQSRSGPPHQPWLEPDVCDHIESLHGEGVKNVVIVSHRIHLRSYGSCL